MTQVANKLQLRLERVESTSNSSKSYYLLIRKDNEMAIDCNCGDRIHRGRKAGRACKHMMARNNKINQQRREAKLVAQTVVKQTRKPVAVVAPAVVTIEDAMDVAQVHMNIHIDQVAAQAEVLNMQKLASHKLADAYEQLTQPKCCPRCGESDLLYPMTGRCQWVPTYEQL